MSTTKAPKPSPAPPGRTGRAAKRSGLLIVAGIFLAGALLVVFMNIDWGGESQRQTPREATQFDEQIDQFVINNGAAGTIEATDDVNAGSHRDVDVELPSGATIVSTDKDGRVVQELVAERLDPQGGGLLKLLRPRATLYMSNGRRLTIEGDDGLARRGADNMIVSGTITGRVVVRQFEDSSRNPRPDDPTMVMLTDHADFDDVRGEIHCPNWVDVQTREAAFSGVNLTALYSDVDGLQRLVVERSTAPLRLLAGAFEGAERSRTRGGTGGGGSTNNAPATPSPDQTPQPSSGSGQSKRDADVFEFGDCVVAATRPMQDPPATRRGESRRADDADWLTRRQREAEERQTQPVEQQTRFYRATFFQNVRIWREGSSETITGEELRLTFSMENKQLSRTAARRTSDIERERRIVSASSMFDLRSFSIASALGFAQSDHFAEYGVQPIMPAPAEGDVYVAHDGQLIVAPLSQSIEHLASVNDYAMEIVGDPVAIDDPDQGLHATCETLDYVSSIDRLALRHGPRHPLIIEHPELSARGERFDYFLSVPESEASVDPKYARTRGEFIGPGEMHLKKAAQDAAAEATALDQQADDVETDQGGAQQHPQEQSRPRPKLDITWSKGVELYFLEDQETPGAQPAPQEPAGAAAAQQNSRLEMAHFTGDVVVDEDRFHMESQDLRLLFNTEAVHDDALKELEAEGDVYVKGLDSKEGELRSDHLFTEFAMNEAGDSLPKRILATGNASVRDLTQHIKAEDHLEFHLVESQRPEGTDAADQAGSFDRVEVERFRAVKNVFVELESGVTATGDLLEGNAVLGNALLTGERVVVDGTPEDVDFHSEGTRAHIERIDGRSVIRMDGAGRASLQNLGRDGQDATEPGGGAPAPAEENEAQGEEPTVGAGPTLQSADTIDITWHEEFMYAEGTDEGAGTLQFRGDVHAVSQAELEENVLDSMQLMVTFAEETLPPVVDSEGNVRQETQRTLRDLIAQGNAKMESRTWETPERSAAPRFTHIRGQYIEYNQQAMSANVPGAGILLINDPRPLPEPKEGESEQEDKSLTGRGATLFEWTERMTMNQSQQDQYAVNMLGGVIMQHDSLKGEQDDGYLTCDELDMTLVRRGAGEREPGLDFGGSTEVERFDASGRVTLSTQGKRIESDQVIYLDSQQLVQIYGTQQTDASFKSEPTRPPMRAKGFLWDLRTDRVTMTGLRSTIPR